MTNKTIVDNSISIVDLIGMDYRLKQHTQDTLTTVEHDSLIIWPETNSFTWFSRNISGGPLTWMKYVLFLSDPEIEDYLNGVDIGLLTLDKYSIEFETRYPVGAKEYCEYFAQRNINPETALFYDLEVYHDDVIIPLYNTFGKRCGSLLRKVNTNDTSKKYRKIINDTLCDLWPYKSLLNRYEKPVLVFEGTWSVMRWHQVLGNEIIPLALIGTNIGDRVTSILNGANVTFILDNDVKSKAGLKVYERIKKQIGYKYQNWKFLLPPKYPDEMSDEEIKIIMNEIRKIRTNTRR